MQTRTVQSLFQLLHPLAQRGFIHSKYTSKSVSLRNINDQLDRGSLLFSFKIRSNIMEEHRYIVLFNFCNVNSNYRRMPIF
ncbi:hypothetical protein D3C73_772470 [compost metagenome]